MKNFILGITVLWATIATFLALVFGYSVLHRDETDEVLNELGSKYVKNDESKKVTMGFVKEDQK